MNKPNSLFTPIKAERTFERVSTRIKRLILDGVLKPGDRLPSESELAQEFNVGRQTIREALRILELSGFITTKKGGNGGPMIQTTVLNTINELFLDAFQLEKVSTVELTVARAEIEKVVLDYAVEFATDDDIQDLQKNIQEARKKIANNIMAIDENVEFHNLLARASGNHVFSMVVGSIMAVVRDHTSRQTSNLEDTAKALKLSESVLKSKNAVDTHEDIVNAILKKDKKKAGVLMENHIREVGQRLDSLKK
jgi:DNA-binding FadR family transcriptional regulator